MSKVNYTYWLTCFSNERIGLRGETRGIRSEFERDYDRIIFSSAFRRLQNKTQVFPLPKHVFVHNRLTHSLEVASVGRSLGKIVGMALSDKKQINSNDSARRFYKNHLKNVIAAACLAHDMGNPAFGHSGEEAISRHFTESEDKYISRFSPSEWKDITTFEGNANTLRVLTRKYNGRLLGGFRLTYSTLASILKYPCASMKSQGKTGPAHLKKYGFFQTEEKAFLEIAAKTKMVEDKSNPGTFFRHPFVYLVEAADDICYNIIDFEDAHRLGILSTEYVEEVFSKLIELNTGDDIKRIKKVAKSLDADPNEKIAYLRAKAINYLTIAAAQVFLKNLQSIETGIYKGSLYENIPGAKTILKDIEKQSYARIYNHPSVVKIELAGFEIMSYLVEKFVEAALTESDKRLKRHNKILEILPRQHQFKETDSNYVKVMNIIDYIAGMTDLYALELYNNIKGIKMPHFD